MLRETTIHTGELATEQVCVLCGGDVWRPVALLIHDVATHQETLATGYCCMACGGTMGSVIPVTTKDGEPDARRTPQ